MEKGCIYHVYNRGISDVRVFRSADNYRFFLRRFEQYVSSHAALLAYCLMPTHFHLLIFVKEDQPSHHPVEPFTRLRSNTLDNAFRKLFISYAKAYNRRNGRHGALFQESYKRKLVISERQFANTLAYIHFNPVSANLSARMSSWAFSSYSHYLEGHTSLVDTERVLRWFGGKAAFFAFHHQYVISKKGSHENSG